MDTYYGCSMEIIWLYYEFSDAIANSMPIYMDFTIFPVDNR